MQPYLEVARAAIVEARARFLKNWGRLAKLTRKNVREARGEVESVLVEFLTQEVPSHGIQNDRTVFQASGGSDCKWYVGGLDVSRSYDSYGPLISLGMVYCHGPITGVIDAPRLGKQWYAAFQEGAFEESNGKTQLLSVSGRFGKDAKLLVHAPDVRAEQLALTEPAAERRMAKSLTRSVLDIMTKGADCYVRSDRFSRSEYCPLDILLCEADGRGTDFRGSPVIYNNGDNSFERGLICSNGLGHNELAIKATQYLRQPQKQGPHNL